MLIAASHTRRYGYWLTILLVGFGLVTIDTIMIQLQWGPRISQVLLVVGLHRCIIGITALATGLVTLGSRRSDMEAWSCSATNGILGARVLWYGEIHCQVPAG